MHSFGTNSSFQLGATAYIIIKEIMVLLPQDSKKFTTFGSLPNLLVMQFPKINSRLSKKFGTHIFLNCITNREGVGFFLCAGIFQKVTEKSPLFVTDFSFFFGKSHWKWSLRLWKFTFCPVEILKNQWQRVWYWLICLYK